MECAQADKMDAGREPAKLWFHCLMAIVLAGQMVFLDSRDAPRSATAELLHLKAPPPSNDQCLQQLSIKTPERKELELLR